jgi:YegS/Rv2252/BmrU family lipid kinase
MATTTIVYNPLAGPADLAPAIDPVAHFWKSQGWTVYLQPTSHAGHAVELARTAAGAGHEMVLAAGGDGTLGEVANGLAGSDTIMAPLPMGTGNSFAKELRLPRRTPLNPDGLLEASQALAAGRVHQMDVGYFPRTQRYWLLWASVGIDSYLVEQIEPRSKLSKRLGPTGYFLQSLTIVPRFSTLRARVEVDDQCYEGDFLMVTVSNCRLYAGGELVLSPEARLDDGQFEIWLFRGKGTSAAVRYLVELALGRHLDDPNATMLKGRRVVVHTETPASFHCDGDPVGMTPLDCELRPGALRLLVPNTAPENLFGQPGQVLAPANGAPRGM